MAIRFALNMSFVPDVCSAFDFAATTTFHLILGA
jgi:hypothetical protein